MQSQTVSSITVFWKFSRASRRLQKSQPGTGCRSVETGVFQNVTAQNRRELLHRSYPAQSSGREPYSSQHSPAILPEPHAPAAGRATAIRRQANLRRDNSVHPAHQEYPRVSAWLCVRGTGAEMTINKGHRDSPVVGANVEVTSLFARQVEHFKCPTSPHGTFSPLSRFDMLGDDNSSLTLILTTRRILAPDTEQSKAPVRSPLPEERTGPKAKQIASYGISKYLQWITSYQRDPACHRAARGMPNRKSRERGHGQQHQTDEVVVLSLVVGCTSPAAGRKPPRAHQQ